MANPHRGSVALQVGDRAYTLSFGVNAMCEVEDALGKSALAIVEEMQKAEKNPSAVRFSTIRAITWAGLLDHHPSVTLKEAGDILTTAGVGPVMEKVGEAFQLAFPPAEGREGARPPDRKR